MKKHKRLKTTDFKSEKLNNQVNKKRKANSIAKLLSNTRR